jgi:hypothetical protein
MDDLQYPIGKFEWTGTAGDGQLRQWVDEIAAAPAQLRAAVRDLSPAQMDTPYRPGGWTVRQVVHHVPDSHMNCYVRVRLALTENEPIIKPYDEAQWAMLQDSRTAPIELSLSLLESLHGRWIILLRSLTAADWQRTFRHPELGLVTLERTAALYAWHGRHHTAHITSLRQRMGWK